MHDAVAVEVEVAVLLLTIVEDILLNVRLALDD
jgi:hypothetical protein